MSTLTPDPGASVVDRTRDAAYRQGVHMAHISPVSHTRHMGHIREEVR